MYMVDDYKLSLNISLTDNFTSKYQGVKKELKGVEKDTFRSVKSFSIIDKSLQNIGKSALQSSGEINHVKRTLQKLKGTVHATIKLKDLATPSALKAHANLQSLNNTPKTIFLRAKDETTARLERIKTNIRHLTSKAHTIFLNVKENAFATNSPLVRAKSFATGAMSGMLMNTPMQMAGAFGLGFGIYDTIETYKKFEKQMQTVKALATSAMSKDEAKEAMKALTEKAREMGAKTQFTAEEAGKAMEYMAMAGWNDKQIKETISSVLNLALASGEDLASVSDIVTDAMTALKIDTQGKDAEKNIKQFTDVLAAASTNSNTNVRGMGEAFKYVAPMAGMFSSSYDNVADVGNDVALALGLMANSGIKGSMAGTALRATLSRMTGETMQTKNALQALGITITRVGKDGTEELKPLGLIFDELRHRVKEGVKSEDLINYAEILTGTKGEHKGAILEFIEKLKTQKGKLSAKDQAYFAKMLGGEEAISGILSIITASDQDYNKLKQAIYNSQGATTKMAMTRADNLAGDIDILKSTWEDFQIELLEGKGSKVLRSFSERTPT